MLCADGSNLHALITLRNCSLKWNDRLTCSCRPRSCFLKVPSMSIYPDFIQILYEFYANFIQISSRFFRNSLYPNLDTVYFPTWSRFYSDFILILSWFYPDVFKNYFKIWIKSGWSEFLRNLDKIWIKSG